MLDLSKVYAYGQFITNSLWNEFRALVEAKFNAGIASSDIAAGGVALSNLANQYAAISSVDRITAPGLLSNDPDQGIWYAANTPPLLLATVYSSYLRNLTTYRSPCDFTLESCWCQTFGGASAGRARLYRKTLTGSFGYLAGTHLEAHVDDPDETVGNLATGLSLSINEGDLLSWRTDGIISSSNLPLVVGFAGKAPHQP